LRAIRNRLPPPGAPNALPWSYAEHRDWGDHPPLLLALLLFGAKRLPEIGRSMGKGMREFKDSVSGKERDDDPAELPLQTTDTTVASRERDTL
jgi:sec-independent protein translocase protein TatA